jgi:GT2 family glycosyltransferase/glycosyltransferase involved in cell wall biosynthesis
LVHEVSIIIPVLNKLEFTRQCLDRIWRNTADAISYEVIVVDNGSSDGTADWFADIGRFPKPIQYQRNATNLGFAAGNNLGAQLSRGRQLLFLNNDTLVEPGWLAEMLRVSRSSPSVGVVGIKQLFPYTNTIYHTGIVFTPEGRPEHLYPHLDASLPQVNKEREYQAVTGACLLMERSLFDDCGGFDEAYRNGYEDIDLCMKVRQRGRTVVCCTAAYIYHYGQISEGRTADDDANAALFASRWGGGLKSDRDAYLIRDRADSERTSRPSVSGIRSLAADCIYLADELDDGSALTWINAELALALQDQGAAVLVNGNAQLSRTLSPQARRRLAPAGVTSAPVGGVQVKWSHYRPRHLNLDLAGDVNLEFFVINYLFGTPRAEPWDFWLQCLQQNGHPKLPLSEFCKMVLQQIGVPERDCHVWYPGYSSEIEQVDAPQGRSGRFRFLTVSNAHDLERYNTVAIIEAFQEAFSPENDVALVIKDYGASSGDTTLHNTIARMKVGHRIEYVGEFTDKNALIRLYKSCDTFVSAHRGEGFGMKILDAMACGLPVITPLFGGPTAYCDPENCLPVSYSLVPMRDCLDTRSLRITNQPMWAEVDRQSLRDQMRRAFDDRPSATATGARGRAKVIRDFSWSSAAHRLLEIAADLCAAQPKSARPKLETSAAPVERSPYWLGLRVTVVVPTHNRKDKLLTCLDALGRQSVLPQEFEVVVIDDGSTDGTREALEARRYSFGLRYFRQEAAGPGSARNLAIERAAGELVLFLGDDIVADDRLIEEHLRAHAAHQDPGVAVLGHIDWPESMTPNAVMEYVCGDAMLQFAYSYIPTAPVLDHRFFYTSNISLKREFLVDAADAGVRFDPGFHRAAFEDSEFALRLMPRGLRIVYAASARAAHDHWMDLDSFARREFGAGEMAVVFYRKHPGQDDQLQVRWLADLVEPASVLLAQPDFLRQLETFDRETDVLLGALAGSLEGLMAIGRHPEPSASGLSGDRLRSGLHNILCVIFDVQRTRGKLQEWFSNVDDPAKVRAAQTLASVMRKIEFLNVNAGNLGSLPDQLPIDPRAVATLSGRIAAIDGMPAPAAAVNRSPLRRGLRQSVQRFLGAPFIFGRVVRADRFIEARLQSAGRDAWLTNYRRVRHRIRSLMG